MSDCLSEMDDARIRKYAENSAPRLMAELCHLLDWDFVEGSEVESLKRQYSRPTLWRLKVWKLLLSTVFRGIQNAGDASVDLDSERCGFIVGLFDSISKALDIGEKSKAKFSGFGLMSSELPEFLEVGGLLKGQDLLAVAATIEADSELAGTSSDFLMGYSKGLKALIDVNLTTSSSHLSSGTDASLIYIALLVFGDYLEQQRSRKHAYDKLQALFSDNSMPHSYESFELICKRIGFVGASYRRRKKRSKDQPELR
jgi:hypothetical protein